LVVPESPRAQDSIAEEQQ
jgi:hypothetical protein